ncbi:MAG: hypothetical protein ABI663_17375 [Chryseolinea sp.]
MKTITKISFTILGFAMLILLTQCSKPTPDTLCSNVETRGKIISTLMNNEAYMNEVMDSMKTKHADVVLATVFVLTKGDKGMQTEMVNNMMSMSESDTTMCKMMMDKTMAMCDADQSKCKMMMGSVQSKSNVMKSMQGMCDMNSMNIKPKKEDHLKH